MKPSYLVSDVDAKTMLPLNFEIWSLDVEDANRTGEPKWELQIDYVNDYKLDPPFVSPDALHDLATRIGESKPLASLFRSDMFRKVDVPRNMTKNDQKQLYCKLATSETFEYDNCMGRGHSNIFADPGNVLLRFVMGDWMQKM
jgi:hypothetical protein